MKPIKKKLTNPPQQLTCFPEGSREHANPTQQPESGSEKKMNATSGQKCLEQFGRLGHVGSWAKTFAGLLVGTGDWYSTRCNLTWKLRATKSSRSYFQLAPSMLPTEGKGYGLLHTPSAQEPGITVERLVTKEGLPARIGERAYDKHTGRLAQIGLTQQVQMLPTPQSRDFRSVTGNEVNQRDNAMQNLNVAAYELTKGMLPTPRASEWKGCGAVGSKSSEDWNKKGYLSGVIQEQTGQTGQLNPRFVAEMMGFPPRYLELPFLNTELRA